MARRRFEDQVGDDGLFVESPPTLLAYILTVDLTSNAGSNFAPKSSILRSIEFKAIGRVALSDSTHDPPLLPGEAERMALVHSRA
jgi:hypothetical protein